MVHQVNLVGVAAPDAALLDHDGLPAGNCARVVLQLHQAERRPGVEHLFRDLPEERGPRVAGDGRGLQLVAVHLHEALQGQLSDRVLKGVQRYIQSRVSYLSQGFVMLFHVSWEGLPGQ